MMASWSSLTAVERHIETWKRTKSVHLVAWKARQQTTTNAIDTPKNSIVLARTSLISDLVMIRFTDTINPAAPA